MGTDLRQMATLVEHSLRAGVRSLFDRDAEAARAVLAGDDEIDRLENTVADQCNRILALYQPVAGNLRRVIAMLQASVDLERMGDLASSLAERSLRILDFPPIEVPERLHGMAERVIVMVDSGIEAFLREDARLARHVRGQDDAVDADNDAIISTIIVRMREHPEEIEPSMSLFSAVRHLERIADHATNVAEDAVYLVEGEVLRHRPEVPVMTAMPSPV